MLVNLHGRAECPLIFIDGQDAHPTGLRAFIFEHSLGQLLFIMQIFISTGEVSGDLQGAMLVEALQRQATKRGTTLEIKALGGSRMEKAGADLLSNTAAIGSVGLSESLRFILPTWKIQQLVKTYLKDNPVDVLILIDYKGWGKGFPNFEPMFLPSAFHFCFVVGRNKRKITNN